MWAITAVFGLLLLTYSVLFPIYRAPDEVSHVDMILGIRHELRYPRFDGRSYSADVWASRAIAGADDSVRPENPFHHTAEQATPRGRRPTFEQLAPYGPTDHRNQVANHPPLYYVLLAAPLFITSVVPWARDWSFDQVVGFLRFLSILMMVPLPIVIFVAARRLYDSPSVGRPRPLYRWQSPNSCTSDRP